MGLAGVGGVRETTMGEVPKVWFGTDKEGGEAEEQVDGEAGIPAQGLQSVLRRTGRI